MLRLRVIVGLLFLAGVSPVLAANVTVTTNSTVTNNNASPISFQSYKIISTSCSSQASPNPPANPTLIPGMSQKFVQTSASCSSPKITGEISYVRNDDGEGCKFTVTTKYEGQYVLANCEIAWLASSKNINCSGSQISSTSTNCSFNLYAGGEGSKTAKQKGH